MKFKVGLASLALVGIALGLSACGGGTSASHVVAPTPSQSSSVLDLTPDQLFLYNVHAETPKSILIPETQLVTTASTVCYAFENGLTPLQVEAQTLNLSLFVDDQWSPVEVGFFVGNAIASYCPQYGAETQAAASSLEAQTTTS